MLRSIHIWLLAWVGIYISGLHDVVCVALTYTPGWMSGGWIMAREKKSHYLYRHGRESVTGFGKLGSSALNQVLCLEKSSSLLNTF